MKHTIVYIDLDGVMVDLYPALWQKMQFRFSDIPSQDRATIDAMWENLAIEQPNFWLELPQMPYAQELFNKITELDPEPHILSATPQPYTCERNTDCAWQKVQWVSKNLPNDTWTRTIITKSKLKQDWIAKEPHAQRKILVDDHPGNIKRWIEAGGIGVHHTDINKTLAELEALKNDCY